MSVLNRVGPNISLGSLPQDSASLLPFQNPPVASLEQDRALRIMRPDGEAPLLASDEVRVEVGDAEVVDRISLCDMALAFANSLTWPSFG